MLPPCPVLAVFITNGYWIFNWNEQVQFSADGLILCMKTPKILPGKLPDQHGNQSGGLQIRISKPTSLKTAWEGNHGNNHSRKSQPTNQRGINLTVTATYTEEIDRWWGGLSCPWTDRINYPENSYPTKSNIQIRCNPHRNPNAIASRSWKKSILKFIWKLKKRP